MGPSCARWKIERPELKGLGCSPRERFPSFPLLPPVSLLPRRFTAAPYKRSDHRPRHKLHLQLPASGLPPSLRA
ncbi:hypothetical protein NL676_032742 [Syzygium grande]|nr:hypothetical protein NL676_032742 [Syzygium grande]